MLNKKGFTFVELIMVAVTIGVLGVVAIPKYSEMQGEARVAAVKGLNAKLHRHMTEALFFAPCGNTVNWDGITINYHYGNAVA